MSQSYVDEEQIDFVDEYDNVLGSMEKNAAYDAGKRVRIACVVITDPETGKIALTRRGATVSWQPLFYAVSACGHIGAGEAWDVAAARETEEEIGLTVPLNCFAKFPFDDEFDQHFILGCYEGHAKPDMINASIREVADLMWVTRDELCDVLEQSDKVHNVSRPTFDKWLEIN